MCRRLQIFFALAAILQLAASVHANPPTPSLAAEKRVILTPTAPKEPRINGAKVYGVRPGKPLLFRIPATWGAAHAVCGQGSSRRAVAGSADRDHQRTDQQPSAEHLSCHAGRREPLGQSRRRVSDRGGRHPGADAADGMEHVLYTLRWNYRG